MSSLIELTKENFDELVRTSSEKTTVVVDFWAAWCSPCRVLASTLEEIAKDYKGNISILKVNVDEQPELSQQFSIKSIPTLLIFENAKVVDTLVGNHPKKYLLEKFKLNKD